MSELGEHPDWPALKEEVCRKIDYIAAAWEKLDAPPEWLDKIRRDLLLPSVELLAEFCACVTENDPEEPDASPCPKCGAWVEEPGEFGVLRHEECSYCAHPSRDDGKCGICGESDARP